MTLRWLLLTLVCWPLLFWQGRRVRKLTLRLPEAAGARAGKHGTGKPLRLLICGDSAAAGVGIAHQQDAISGKLVQRLSATYRVSWQLQAKTGIDSAALAALLQSLPAQPLDVVVISIGVNDVTSVGSLRRFRRHIRQILVCLRHRFANPLVLFSPIPPMQQFSALPAPLNIWLGLKAAMLNNVLQRELLQWPKALRLDNPRHISPDMLAPDGYHPSALGCEIWARQLTDRLTFQQTGPLPDAITTATSSQPEVSL